MAKPRLLTVFVHNAKNYAVSGCKVQLYGGDTIKTDDKGKASFLVETSKCTIFVDGTTAYDGFVSNAPELITWEV